MASLTTISVFHPLSKLKVKSGPCKLFDFEFLGINNLFQWIWNNFLLEFDQPICIVKHIHIVTNIYTLQINSRDKNMISDFLGL